MRFTSYLLIVICCCALFTSCVESTNQQSEKPEPKITPVKKVIHVPEFNSDSAYRYIQKQVEFGPRVPNSDAHAACADWLIKELSRFCDSTIVQKTTLMAFDGTRLRAQNIIGQFNLDAKKRILLCAHWDTRPFADQDSEDREVPIAGANDGGSGVGVLLELARMIAANPVEIGIDIVLFDAEDYGQRAEDKPVKQGTYCLGSQYWSANPHVPNYKADFGILLDMVGAKGSTFTLEGISMRFAESVMMKVWNTANALGYLEYFKYDRTSDVMDDHFYVNTIRGIPTIDIIDRKQGVGYGFGHYWHTHDDNMDIIDKNVLKAVGQTVTRVIYKENG